MVSMTHLALLNDDARLNIHDVCHRSIQVFICFRVAKYRNNVTYLCTLMIGMQEKELNLKRSNILVHS